MRDADHDGTADKKDEREGWVAPDSLTKTLDAKRFDGRVITSTRYKSNGTLTWVPHYSTKDVAQIFVVPAEGGTAGATHAARVCTLAAHVDTGQRDDSLCRRSQPG